MKQRKQANMDEGGKKFCSFPVGSQMSCDTILKANQPGKAEESLKG